MKPIGYITNGMAFICPELECASAFTDAPVLGSCIDRKCGSCGEVIKANREYGRAAWRQISTAVK